MGNEFVMVPKEPSDNILRAMQMRGLNVSADGYGCLGGLYEDAARLVYAEIVRLAKQERNTEVRFVCKEMPDAGDQCVFIECEDSSGASIYAGDWRWRDDGLCELVVKMPAAHQGEPVVIQKVHVEVRECEGCNHIGIDDHHVSLAACHECDWSGPEPVEDKCPGCERENVMAAACPDCGSRYVLATSKTIEVVDDTAEVDRLRALSVTNILLDVVPGDGSGHEVYAKSVQDVVDKFGQMGDRIELLEGQADPGEVERLRAQVSEWQETSVYWMKERDEMRAQLAELEALLSEWRRTWGSQYRQDSAILIKTDAALSASAEPSAPKCGTCKGTGMVDDGEITGVGGVEFENGPVKCVKDCPDCTHSEPDADPCREAIQKLRKTICLPESVEKMLDQALKGERP